MSRRDTDYVMTIDAGTGSGRALIFDADANPIAAAAREWTLPTIPDVPGSAVFDTDAAWTLRRPTGGYRVHVHAAGAEIGVVSPGESIELQGGRLVFADLRLWMGYSVDYYPFLPWMFVAAMLAIGGLAIHFGTRYLPQAERKTEAVMKEAPDGHVIGA